MTFHKTITNTKARNECRHDKQETPIRFQMGVTRACNFSRYIIMRDKIQLAAIFLSALDSCSKAWSTAAAGSSFHVVRFAVRFAGLRFAGLRL